MQLFYQTKSIFNFFNGSGILLALDKCPHKFNCKKLLCFIMDSLDQIHLCSNSIVGNIDTIYSAMTNLINQYFYNGILEKNTEAS